MESTGEFSYNYHSTPGSRPYVSNEAGMEGLGGVAERGGI